MRKIIFIFCYGLKLLRLTYSQFKYSQQLVESYYKGLGSNEKRYLGSLSLNCTFVGTVIYEYKTLVNQVKCYPRELQSKITVLMLLEDILLDEVKVAPERINNIFLGKEIKHCSGLEKLYAQLLGEINKQMPQKYRKKQWQLISRLYDVQLGNLNSNDQKGIWLPAIAFGVNPEMSDGELHFLTSFGQIMKLVDDLADARIDKTVSVINEGFTVEQKMLELKAEVYSLGFSKKRSNYFFNTQQFKQLHSKDMRWLQIYYQRKYEN